MKIIIFLGGYKILLIKSDRLKSHSENFCISAKKPVSKEKHLKERLSFGQRAMNYKCGYLE